MEGRGARGIVASDAETEARLSGERRSGATAPAEAGSWTLCRHADVIAAANDPETFSSRVSAHLNVPNGMDGEEHARFRTLIDRYFTPERVAHLEPRFRRIAAELIAALPADGPVEAVGEVGARFAVRAQSAWLGWPAELEDTLLGWMAENREATRSGDYDRTAAVARRFDEIIHSVIDARRAAGGGVGSAAPKTTTGAAPEPNRAVTLTPADLTDELLTDRVCGRPLTDEEIVSILRNWTAGDLGSIAACIGVVIHHLAVDRALQDRWRRAHPARPEIEAGIDEMLRIDDPFTFNRRVATRDTEIGGRGVSAGDRIKLDWTAANRDPRVVGNPDAYRPAANAPHNLVYGVGPHACPGRGLATLELRLVVEELLSATGSFELTSADPPARELPPYGGYRTVPIWITRAPGASHAAAAGTATSANPGETSP